MRRIVRGRERYEPQVTAPAHSDVAQIKKNAMYL